jgi:8-oxo-dGTP pyrophosphatase MutT (NUDIX family)
MVSFHKSMRKKLILVSFFALFTILSVFGAGSSGFFLQTVPFSSRISGEERSSYGFGAEVGYRRNASGGLNYGADFSFRTFSFDKAPRQYVWSFIAKAGWKKAFGSGNKLSAAVSLGLGADFVHSSDGVDVKLAATAGTAFAISLGTHTQLTAGVDYGFLDRSVTAKVGLVFTLTTYPYRGAGVGLVMDGKILMGKRLGTPMFNNTWAVPGGTYETFDADDFETAVRELWEETAIDLSKLDAVSIGEWKFAVPFFSWKTYFYTIDEMDQEIVLREFSEYRWLEIDKILDGSYKDLDFRPFTRSEIRRLKNLLEAQK